MNEISAIDKDVIISTVSVQQQKATQQEEEQLDQTDNTVLGIYVDISG